MRKQDTGGKVIMDGAGRNVKDIQVSRTRERNMSCKGALSTLKTMGKTTECHGQEGFGWQWSECQKPGRKRNGDLHRENFEDLT
jgi:hypothetical protein